MLNIGDKLYHPCSVDIIESKVTGIRQYEDLVMYEMQAIHDVGACGRVKILVACNKEGKYFYTELLSECEYASGLKDFVEGEYFETLAEAKIEFYRVQETLIWSKVERLKRELGEAEAQHRRIKSIIEVCKKEAK